MSYFDSIVAARLGRAVAVDEVVTVAVDRLYVQDGNTPTMARYLGQIGAQRHHIQLAPHVVFDHSSTAPTAGISSQMALARACARQFGFQVVREGAGISHVHAAEHGFFQPGGIVLGSDSHTCIGGAFQCMALGMGMSDILFAMLTGSTWLKIPHTVQIHVHGALRAGVGAKDLALYLLATLPADALVYRSVEYLGDTIRALSPDGAQTLASMAVELGAKCCFLDRLPTAALPTLRQLPAVPPLCIADIDAASVPLMVAVPGQTGPVPLDQLAGTVLDMCFLGSCTNGRFEDFVAFSDALAGRSVAPHIVCQATPGSADIYLRLIQSGVLATLVRAGVMVTPPGCGPCAGVQGHIPHDGATVLSTMNRNFKGRMGNRNATIYLCGPRLLAHAAVLGRMPASVELADAT